MIDPPKEYPLRDKTKLYVITYSDPNPHDENRQSFSAEWWSAGYHLGAQWRGQMFYSTIDDVAKQFPGKEVVVTKGEINVRYHSRRS